MKRKITVEIETDDSGKFCGQECSFLVGGGSIELGPGPQDQIDIDYLCINPEWECELERSGDDAVRCQACRDAELAVDQKAVKIARTLDRICIGCDVKNCDDCSYSMERSIELARAYLRTVGKDDD